jgi:hypothetical protein
MKQIAQGKFGLRRCPECNSVQSWVKKRREDRRTGIAITASISFFIFVGSLIGWLRAMGLGQCRGFLSDVFRIGCALLRYFVFLVLVSDHFSALHSCSSRPLTKNGTGRTGKEARTPGILRLRSRCLFGMLSTSPPIGDMLFPSKQVELMMTTQARDGNSADWACRTMNDRERR